MSREKQIEGIVKAIKKKCIDIFNEKGLLVDDCPFPYTCEECMARQIYNAGYRKQSEGEWIDKPTGAYGRMQSWCSACGKHSGIGGIESNRHKPYCPNCGAKMKGESNE